MEISPTGQAAMSIAGFCDAYGITRPLLYKLWKQGIGPKTINLGRRRLISIAAASAWQQEREAASNVVKDGAR